MARSFYCKKKVASNFDVKIPKIDEVKPLSLEKVCPSCGKDLQPNAIICDNSSCPNPRAVAGTAPRTKDRKPDEKGSGGARIQQHETVVRGAPVVKAPIPSLGVAAQSINQNFVPLAKNIVKPINNKRISDDDAEVCDENHLQDVEHSANHLGL